MANNKVVLGNETLIDLTSDTATEETVLEGYTFHSADGQLRTGLAVAGGGDDKMDIDGSNADLAVTFSDSAFTIGSRASSYERAPICDYKSMLASLPFTMDSNSKLKLVLFRNKIHVFVTDGVHYTWDGINWEIDVKAPYYTTGSIFVVHDNKIHLLGGNQSPYSKYHYSYDGINWAYIGSSIPEDLNSANGCHAASLNNKLYISYGQYTAFYSWNGSSWDREVDKPFREYAGSCSIVFNNRLYIIGGSTSYFSNAPYLVMEYDGTRWSYSVSIPFKFSYGSAVVYDNKVHIFGSSTSPYTQHYSCSNLSGDRLIWTEELSTPASASYNSSVMFDNKIHLFGYNLGWYTYSNNNYNPVDKLPKDFRYGSAVVYDGKVHILGGASPFNSHYSWDGSEWIQEENLPTAKFINGSAVVYDNKVHIFGGEGNDGSIYYSKQHYSWDGSTWTQETDIPYNFYKGEAVVYDGKIHLLGASSSPYTKHYSWNGLTWAQETDIPYNFYNGSAVVYDGKIHLLGGNVDSVYNSYQHYSWDGLTWTQETDIPYSFYNNSAVIYNGKIYTIGANSGNTGIVMSYANDQWTIYEPFNAAGTGSVSFVYDNKLYNISSINSFYNLLIEDGGIVNIINYKPKTMVLGERSVSEGKYSTVKGDDSLALGDFSSIEGNDIKSTKDFDHIFSGDKTKFKGIGFGIPEEFAFGFKLLNNFSFTGNSSTYEDAIDAEYGYSGTICNKKINTSLNFKIARFGFYLLFAMGYNEAGNYICSSVCFISGTLSGASIQTIYSNPASASSSAKPFTISSRGYQVDNYSVPGIYINTMDTNWACQVVLIRLA